VSASPLLRRVKSLILCIKNPICRGAPKGPRKNKLPFWATDLGQIWLARKERNRRHSSAYVEDFATEDRPKMA